jgi:hypothetical protein
MGTSISQRSPSTPGWKAVGEIYSSPDYPIDRAVTEIWRAATNQPEGNIASDLSEPIIAKCFEIVQNARSREDALSRAGRAIALSGEVSLAVDIAQRAISVSFDQPLDRISAFTQSLFAEAGNYLVSRDLSGYIGVGNRAKNVSDAIKFKGAILDHIVQVVRTIPKPSGNASDPSVWRGYVNSIASSLSRRGSHV